MSGKVLRLVPPETLDERIKQAVLDLLSEATKMAQDGRIVSIIIIAKNVDGSWAENTSGTKFFADAIGQLEIMKQHWIRKYFEQGNK